MGENLIRNQNDADRCFAESRYRDSRLQVRKLLDDYQDDELQRLGNGAIEAINDWELKITQVKHETYEDEDAWETMLDGQLRFLMDVVDASGAPVTDGAKTRFTDLDQQWQLRQEELRSISADYLALLIGGRMIKRCLTSR